MNTEKRIHWKRDIEGFEKYLRDRENAEATIEKYLRDVRTFRKYRKGQELLNKDVLRKYKEWLLERYCVSSVNSMLVALNQFLIFKEAGWLRVKRVKIQAQGFRNMDRELSREEFRRLVAEARGRGQKQLAMIMETICATGIRVSELKFFRADSVKNGMVQVRNKGKHRTVLLPEKLRKKLILYMTKNKIKKGCIFCTRTGKAKDRSNIWKEMKGLAAVSGISPKKIFPHNLRHLFARTFYKTTKNLIHLADLLGHSSLEVTRIYTCDGIEELKNSLEQLDLINGIV